MFIFKPFCEHCSLCQQVAVMEALPENSPKSQPDFAATSAQERMKKKRRSREVTNSDMAEYMKRPVIRPENLNDSLRRSYENSGRQRKKRYDYMSYAQQEQQPLPTEPKQNPLATIYSETSSITDNAEPQPQQLDEQSQKQQPLQQQPQQQQPPQQQLLNGEEEGEAEESEKLSSQPEQHPQGRQIDSESSEESESQSEYSQNSQNDNQPSEQGFSRSKRTVRKGTGSLSGRNMRRRNFNEMILGYQIEYLQFMLSINKVIRTRLKPRPQKSSREEEWRSSFSKYQKLVKTMQRDIDYKSLMVQKIEQLGRSQDGPNAEQKLRDSRASSSSSLSQTLSQKELTVKHNMEKTMQYFKRENDQQNCRNDEFCLKKLKEARRLMDLIDENIQFVKQRPSNFVWQKRGKGVSGSKENKSKDAKDSGSTDGTLKKETVTRKHQSNRLEQVRDEAEKGKRVEKLAVIVKREIPKREILKQQTVQAKLSPMELQDEVIHKQQAAAVMQEEMQAHANTQQKMPSKISAHNASTLLEAKQKKLTFQPRIIAESLYISIKNQPIQAPPRQQEQQPLQEKPKTQVKVDRREQRDQYTPARKKKTCRIIEDQSCSSEEQDYKKFNEFKRYMKFMKSYAKTPRYRKQRYQEIPYEVQYDNIPYEKRIFRRVKRKKNHESQEIKIEDSDNENTFRYRQSSRVNH